MIKITIEELATNEILNKGAFQKKVIAYIAPCLSGNGRYFYDLRDENGHTARMGYVSSFKKRLFNVWFLLAGVLSFAYSDLSDAWEDGKVEGRHQERK